MMWPSKLVMAALVFVAIPVVGWCADGRFCNVTSQESEQFEVVAEATRRCQANDIIRMFVTGSQNRRGVLAAYLPGRLCRFDRQIAFQPGGDEVVCVFRGAARSVAE